MKKAIIILFLFFSLFIGHVLAQTIDAAVKAYDVGDYKTAISELDKVLANASTMKEKPLARAYYYRGQSKVVLIRKNKDDHAPELQKQVRNWAITAVEDLNLAKKNDIDIKLAPDIQAAIKKLNELLLDLANNSLLAAVDGAKSDAEKKVLYEDVVKYCDPVMANDKFNYLAYDLQGDAQLFLLDSLKALKNYHLADDWFFRSAPKDGEMAIAYTYIHIAELEWHLNHKFDVAMKALEEGKTMLEGESKKIQSLSNRPPTEKAYLSKRHDIILTDLNKAENDLKAASAGK